MAAATAENLIEAEAAIAGPSRTDGVEIVMKTAATLVSLMLASAQ